MGNRTVGNRFEVDFCKVLSAHDMWVHRLTQNNAGQPADVIAVKNKTAYLIDCKVCSHKIFPLSRIEENQHFAMELWKQCGNGEGWFALKVGEEVYMLSHTDLIKMSYEKSVLSRSDIVEQGILLEGWLKNVN